jgi:hypothetical protein
MRDERLAAAYASADVFVFPSLTDTFGLVLLEALASGLPVAANPVVGPLDMIGDSGAGILDANLGRAALAALPIPRELARARARLPSASAVRATICRRDRDPGFCSHKGSILPMCRVMKRAISDSARLQPEIPNAAECERSARLHPVSFDGVTRDELMACDHGRHVQRQWRDGRGSNSVKGLIV